MEYVNSMMLIKKFLLTSFLIFLGFPAFDEDHFSRAGNPPPCVNLSDSASAQKLAGFASVRRTYNAVMFHFVYKTGSAVKAYF